MDTSYFGYVLDVVDDICHGAPVQVMLALTTVPLCVDGRLIPGQFNTKASEFVEHLLRLTCRLGDDETLEEDDHHDSARISNGPQNIVRDVPGMGSQSVRVGVRRDDRRVSHIESVSHCVD